MTSTNLFFKRVRSEMKRSLWVLALGIMVYFFTFPVACAVVLSRMDGASYEKQDAIIDLLDCLGTGNMFVVICTVAAAVICALSQFHYLQSKKQSDFYESMPVTRKQMYLTKAASGLLIYCISYFGNILLALLIISARGCQSDDMLKCVLTAGFYHLIGFLLVYLSCILAILLSGKIIVSILIMAFTFFAGPVGYLLYREMMAYFFSTYYSSADLNLHLLEKSSLLMPYINLIHSATDGSGTRWHVIGILAVIVILYFITLFVYRKRRAEDAQKSVVFKPVFTVIKFITVLLSSYGFALLMETMTDTTRKGGWFVFGLVMGMFISSVLLEIIQNSDFKCAFAHKSHLLILAGILAVSFIILRFDVFGYDRYLPDADKIESAAIDFKEIDWYADGVDFSDSQLEYMNMHKYRQTYMKLTEYDDLLAIAKAGIKAVKATPFTEYEKYGKNITITYRLKSGREIYREYDIDQIYEMPEFAHIYDQPAYKMGVFPILNIPSETVSQIFCDREGISVQLGKNQAEVTKLADVYKEELSTLTAQEVKEKAPIARLQFQYPRGIHYSSQMYIYPSFTKTIALISEYGFPLSETMNVSKIQQITVYGVIDESLISSGANVYGGVENEIKEMAESRLEGSVTITDPEIIAKVYACLEPAELSDVNRYLHKARSNYWAEVRIATGEYEQVLNGSYYFKMEELPEDVAKFLKESIRIGN